MQRRQDNNCILKAVYAWATAVEGLWPFLPPKQRIPIILFFYIFLHRCKIVLPINYFLIRTTLVVDI